MTETTSPKPANLDPKDIPDYLLSMSITFSDPSIWRSLQVPGSITLASLHHIIQISMGWEDVDTHQFLVGKIFYQQGAGINRPGGGKGQYSEDHYALYQLEDGMKFIFTYLYDGGEGWEIQLKLEDILYGKERRDTPCLIQGERAAPPEAVRDIHQYQALFDGDELDQLKFIQLTGRESNHHFNPEHVDREQINQQLASLAKGF
ncbi:MAG: plasmid pRiA4b ORF-3 family protein [Desulfobulbaceae bacterium]|nr:MAG: plasmid pRiA4b ORF-3 family protein [Desulfobulbaceae bacterium]